MDKCEEIRDGLYSHLCKRDKGMDFTLSDKQQRWLVIHILKYLDSVDVVIKADRELAKFVICDEAVCNIECHSKEQRNLTFAGYVAVTNLV